MKRNLLTQIKNEWRDNVWLIIELAVVCLAIWVILTILFINIYGLFTPRGFSPDNVYSLNANTVPKESVDYIELENYPQDYFDDLRTLVGKLKNNRNVEEVAIHHNGLPYNYNYNGGGLFLLDELDTLGYSGNIREVTPDYIKVMGITSKTGATTDQLVEMLKNGKILISDNQTFDGDPYLLKGKKVIFGNDTSNVKQVGDIIQKVRRNDYELSLDGCIIVPIPEDNAWGQLVIRVKPGKGKAFEEDFKNDGNLRRLCDTYLADLQSLNDIRAANQRSIEVDLRLYYVMIGFLLMTVFLGLLGTFWFRMQQRISEIAIRKVTGANKNQIFRRIISEGLFLLSCSVLIVSAIMWPLIFSDVEILNVGIEKTTILLIEAATIVLVAIGIIISLWWPARKAMSIQPAIAIKDE